MLEIPATHIGPEHGGSNPTFPAEQARVAVTLFVDFHPIPSFDLIWQIPMFLCLPPKESVKQLRRFRFALFGPETIVTYIFLGLKWVDLMIVSYIFQVACECQKCNTTVWGVDILLRILYFLFCILFFSYFLKNFCTFNVTYMFEVPLGLRRRHH